MRGGGGGHCFFQPFLPNSSIFDRIQRNSESLFDFFLVFFSNVHCKSAENVRLWHEI